MADRARQTVACLGALAAFLLPLALAPTPADAGKRPPKQFFGVHLRSLDGSDFARMRDANVGLVRTGFPISAARTRAADPYDWSRFDPIVAGAAQQGIGLLPVIQGLPPWAPGGLGAILDDPMNAAWQDYVAALVRRYGPGGEFWSERPDVPYWPIRRWQVWNEPNSGVNWLHPDPAAYGKFLTRSARTIHAADPGAQVVSAGVVAAPINPDLQAGASYLRDMLRSRAVRRSIDMVSIHPYTKTVAQAKRLIADARAVLDDARMDDTPIWVTEIGWGATTNATRPAIGDRLGRWQIDPAKQRRNLRKAFEMGVEQRKGLGIAGLVWYQWKDGEDPACGWCETSGLLRANDTAKPLLGAFRKVASR